MELGQMDCEASRCAVCSRVVWSRGLTSPGLGREEWSERGECSSWAVIV